MPRWEGQQSRARRWIQVGEGVGKGESPAEPRGAPPSFSSERLAKGFKHPLKLICWIKPFLHSLH